MKQEATQVTAFSTRELRRFIRDKIEARKSVVQVLRTTPFTENKEGEPVADYIVIFSV